MEYLGPHSEVEGEREREDTWVQGSAFTGDQGGEPRISRAYSLSVNLKHKSRNLNSRKGKKTSFPKVSYQKSTKISKTREPRREDEAGGFWLFI